MLIWNILFFGFIMLIVFGVDYSIFLMMKYCEFDNLVVILSIWIVRVFVVIGVVVLFVVLILSGMFVVLMLFGVLMLI